MKNILKKIKNMFISKYLRIAHFDIKEIEESIEKKYNDMGWFCHEIIHNQIMLNIIDIYPSKEGLDVVYDIRETNIEMITYQLNKIGIMVTCNNLSFINGLFKEK
jgi:hypothetical protein